MAMNTPTPDKIELHLAPFGQIDFCKKYGRKIKALGGTYTNCRGYSDRRFVTIPWNEKNKELMNELIRNFQTKRTLAIIRLGWHSTLPSYIVVCELPKVLPDDPMKWVLNSFELKYLNATAKWPNLAKESA